MKEINFIQSNICNWLKRCPVQESKPRPLTSAVSALLLSYLNRQQASTLHRNHLIVNNIGYYQDIYSAM